MIFKGKLLTIWSFTKKKKKKSQSLFFSKYALIILFLFLNKFLEEFLAYRKIMQL